MLHLLPHWNYVNEKVEITKMCGHGLGIHILKDKILILTKQEWSGFERNKNELWTRKVQRLDTNITFP